MHYMQEEMTDTIYRRYQRVLFIFMKSLLIINLIAERRNSLLFNFFQHYLFAIQNFLKLYGKYKDSNYALEIFNEITIQFYARIKTWSCFPVMVTAYLCTPEVKQHAKIIRERMINPNDDIVLMSLLIMT